MVVDYRELNKVTVRKFFLIPNSDYIKSTVAGNYLISVGDLKEGFNQVDNEPETRKKMAVLSAGGCWLPRGLTFGPTNGPEDFQELVFTVFQRRLYKDWFLFVDDLSVATGRKKCHGDGPSGAHDVSCQVRAETDSEKALRCLGMEAGGAFPSPYAHALKEETSDYVQIVSKDGGTEWVRKKSSRGRHPVQYVDTRVWRPRDPALSPLPENQIAGGPPRARRNNPEWQEWNRVRAVEASIARARCEEKHQRRYGNRVSDGTTVIPAFNPEMFESASPAVPENQTAGGPSRALWKNQEPRHRVSWQEMKRAAAIATEIESCAARERCEREQQRRYGDRVSDGTTAIPAFNPELFESASPAVPTESDAQSSNSQETSEEQAPIRFGEVSEAQSSNSRETCKEPVASRASEELFTFRTLEELTGEFAQQLRITAAGKKGT
jgi:hypothetical protein